MVRMLAGASGRQLAAPALPVPAAGKSGTGQLCALAGRAGAGAPAPSLTCIFSTSSYAASSGSSAYARTPMSLKDSETLQHQSARAVRPPAPVMRAPLLSSYTRAMQSWAAWGIVAQPLFVTISGAASEQTWSHVGHREGCLVWSRTPSRRASSSASS